MVDWRARNTVFTFQRFVEINGEPAPLSGIAVTGNLFDVLGVRPLLGRTFTWDETFDGKDRVLVLA